MKPNKSDLAFLEPKLHKFVVTHAQLLTSSAVAIPILPGKPRFVLMPTELWLTHGAGTPAYGAPGRLQLQYEGAGAVLMSAVATTFFSTTTAARLYIPCIASSGGVYRELDITGANQGIELQPSSPITNGNANVALYGLLRYFELPHSLTEI